MENTNITETIYIIIRLDIIRLVNRQRMKFNMNNSVFSTSYIMK